MTDAASNPTPRKTPRRGFKLPAGVATILVLMCIGAGGWFVWEQLKPRPKVDLSQYEPVGGEAAQARARFNRRGTGGNPNRPAPTGIPGGGSVVAAADGTGSIRIDGARARFTKDGTKVKLDLQYIGTAFQPANDASAIMARFYAISDPNPARTAGITDEQIKKLRAMQYVREMIASDAARSQILDQWTAYTAAPADQKKALEPPLIELFRKTSSESISATLVSTKQTADQVRAILTPEQITAVHNARRGG